MSEDLGRITCGLESMELHGDNDEGLDCSGEPPDNADDEQSFCERTAPEETDVTDEQHAGDDDSVTGSVVTQRRALLADQLSSYRHQKLKRKLPADVQLLECAQEDLKVKKALVIQMDKMDQMFMNNMSQMSSNMTQLSSAIADGFGMLRGLLLPG